VQIYRNNTNPPEITGDGIALAYAAGAKIQDMEFVQFHPTSLYEPQRKASTAFLISEAVRGEGAILRNMKLQRFMRSYHPYAELAPRDVVARAIWQEMQKTKTTHVLLDLSTVSLNLKERFPSIYKHCAELGFDITRDLVPVVPAAHYTMGGIKTDLNGQTTVNNLYAAGETAATGVHGANRLASNSLLEALVFGRRAAQYMLRQVKQPLVIPKHIVQVPFVKETNSKQRARIQDICWQHVGIIRNAQGLRTAVKELTTIKREQNDPETNNLLTCAQLTARAALRRTESRGSHFRSDYPHKRLFWHRHITL
jgi:L-aspartate oxidase